MSDTLSKLKELKNTLNNLETKEESKLEKEETKKVDNKELLNLRLKELKEIQKQRVKVNAGGENYSISKNKLNSTIVKNIYTDKEGYDFFFDCNPFLFKHIFNIILHINKTNINEKDKDKEQKLNIILNIDEDLVVLKEMIKEFFLDSEEIFNYINIEKVKVKETVTEVRNEENNDNAANNDYYGGRNAAYNNDYDY